MSMGQAHIDVATGSTAYQPGDLGAASIGGADRAGDRTNDREAPIMATLLVRRLEENLASPDTGPAKT
ncbi:MAG: hypothetical protein ACREJ5_06835 [Geminicoccaceae bacterium]